MPEIIVKLGDSIVQKNIFVKETIRIGRVPDNEIVVENLAVSRYHSVIEYEDGRYLLSDLDSSNGTFVNGVRIKKTELQDRDVITIGKHKLYFYDQRAVAEPKPRPPVMGDIERTMMVEQQAPPPQAELEIVKGRQKGTRFVINGAQTSIGRGAFNDIQLTDWFVSKVHAVIERRGAEFVVRDLGSWRHTYVNGIMIHELPLTDGDTIQMGPTVQLTFNLLRQEQPLPSTARVPVELAPLDEMLRSPRFDRETADSGERRMSVRVAAGQAEREGFPPAAAREDVLESLRLGGDPDRGLHGGRSSKEEGFGGLEDVEDMDAGDAGAGVPPLGIITEPLPLSINWKPAPVGEERAAESERPESIAAPRAEARTPNELASAGNGLATAATPEPAAGGAADREIAMWERALKNKNPIIRKQAARQLQKLTGKQYDYT